MACLGHFNLAETTTIQPRPQPISSNQVARLGCSRCISSEENISPFPVSRVEGVFCPVAHVSLARQLNRYNGAWQLEAITSEILEMVKDQWWPPIQSCSVPDMKGTTSIQRNLCLIIIDTIYKFPVFINKEYIDIENHYSCVFLCLATVS